MNIIRKYIDVSVATLLFCSGMLVGMVALTYINKNKENKVVIVHENLDFLMSDNPEKDLPKVLEYYGLKHPDILYAQAVLETGHFKSYNCIKNNNLFGLYDSKNKRFFKFDHWTESVLAYKNMIQYKYTEGNYYKFLEDLGYAEDSLYINKVKNIVKRYESK